ncbi:MAG: photosystem II stability/assembly factor-like uncharacterized protein [Aquiluna sp.]|jgi:photosystem II stability/assembly factor-like uncharacterized protein
MEMKNYSKSWPMLRALGMAGAILLVATGCASAPGPKAIAQMEHVHSVAADGGNFYLASHHGIYKWSDEGWNLIGEEFDAMGLTIDRGVFYASGHPGPGQDFPNPLGILESRDNGDTWTPKSLTGEVDFHLLEVSGDSLVGVAANYGVVVGSQDGAVTWSNIATPSLTSLSLNPNNGLQFLLTSEGFLYLTEDSGLSLTEITAPSGLTKVDWSDSGIILATDSTIYRSSELGMPFLEMSESFTGIRDVAASGVSIIVLDEQGAYVSTDNGKVFSLLP